jgi:hypothetical protein
MFDNALDLLLRDVSGRTLQIVKQNTPEPVKAGLLQQGEICSVPEPSSPTGRCILFRHHNGPHQSFVSEWGEGELKSRRRARPLDLKHTAATKQNFQGKRFQFKRSRRSPGDAGLPAMFNTVDQTLSLGQTIYRSGEFLE